VCVDGDIKPYLLTYSRTAWVSRYHSVEPFWILLQQEVMKVVVVTTGTVLMAIFQVNLG